MGQVPLLTREQEVEISKRIETAELKAQEALYPGAVIGAYIGGLGAKAAQPRRAFRPRRHRQENRVREAYFKGLRSWSRTRQESESGVD